MLSSNCLSNWSILLVSRGGEDDDDLGVNSVSRRDESEACGLNMMDGTTYENVNVESYDVFGPSPPKCDLVSCHRLQTCSDAGIGSAQSSHLFRLRTSGVLTTAALTCNLLLS